MTIKLSTNPYYVGKNERFQMNWGGQLIYGGRDKGV